jgi:uncharacterized protein
MRIAFALLALIFLSAFTPAASMPVPAIAADNEGIISTFYADARPGSGAVYVDTEPFVGIETQNSERVAARVAADIAGVDRNKYDVFFRITADAEIVDGPSGGAAMALLLLSVLQNKSMRGDFSITGTIRSDGSIGAVGGIFQKARAASEAGIKVFAIPRGQAMQEGRNVIAYAKKNWNQTVVEVSDVEEAAAIAFSNGTLQANATQRVLPPLNLTALALPQTHAYSFFRNLTEAQVSDAEALVRELRVNASDEEQELLNASAEALNTSRYLLVRNYLYSAANIAFVTKGELMLLKGINASRDDVEALVSRVEALVGNASIPMTREFELSAGGALRVNWARKRIAEAAEALGSASARALLSVQRDAITAQNWADAAQQMLAAATGEPVEQAALYDYAAARIREASRYAANASDEAAWHLESSRELFARGEYAAAIFDADFALSFAKADAYAEGRDARQLLAAMPQENVSGFWPSLYAAHARYLVAEANRSADRETALNALKVAYYAERLDAATSAMAGMLKAKRLPTVIVTSTPAPAQKPVAVLDARGIAFAATVLVIALLLVLAVLIPARLRRKPKRDVLEKLEQRLAEGWISESTYERLRRKYEHTHVARGEQPAAPQWRLRREYAHAQGQQGAHAHAKPRWKYTNLNRKRKTT